MNASSESGLWAIVISRGCAAWICGSADSVLEEEADAVTAGWFLSNFYNSASCFLSPPRFMRRSAANHLFRFAQTQPACGNCSGSTDFKHITGKKGNH